MREGLAIARAMGITEDDILEVRRLASLVSMHGVTEGLSVVADEFVKLGVPLPPLGEQAMQDRAAYLDVSPNRAWSDGKELAASLSPAAYREVLRYIDDSVPGSTLTGKERELVNISLVINSTHIFEPGIRRHVGAALAAGATHADIADVGVLSSYLARSSFDSGEC